MSNDRSVEQPASCLSCHAIGITAASALGAYMFYRAKQANSSTHRFTCAIFGLGICCRAIRRVIVLDHEDSLPLETNMCSRRFSESINSSCLSLIISEPKTSSIDELNLLTGDINDKRFQFKELIRLIMRTFYPPPSSFVIEYIYHHKSINLEDLAKLLCLNPKRVQSDIQLFKRDRFIIEEQRRESNVDLGNKFDAKTLYYRIDLARFVNMVKYRLQKMRLEVEDFEREELSEQILYKCNQCSKKYSEYDIAKLTENNRGEDLICKQCPGIICENNPTEQETIRCDMRLFNEQMTPIFQTLERIDEIMKDEPSIIDSCDLEKNDDEYPNTNDINVEITKLNDKISVKPMPEWFARSSVHPETYESDS